MENCFGMEQVTDLEVEAGAVQLTFREAADNEIRVTAENLEGGVYACELRGSRLVVSYQPRGMRVIRGIGQMKTRIIMYFPAGSAFDNVEMEIGACELYMDATPFSCKRMRMDIGAGKWKAKQLSVSDKLEIEVGAGKVKLSESKAGSLDISCGAGACAFAGRIDGDINVSCGVGKCGLRLDNEENDFCYDISCALGKVIVNDSKAACVSTQRFGNGKGCLGTATLECGIGEIEVRTR